MTNLKITNVTFEETERPARTIPLSHSSHLTGRVQSDKSRLYTSFESSLERDAMLLAEFCPEIDSYKSQPITIRFDEGDKRRRYTPDLIIRMSNGNQFLIEIKPRDKIRSSWPKLKPKFKAAIRVAALFDTPTTFKIWTEVEIRTQYLSNAKFLLHYKNKPYHEYQGVMLIQTLDKLRESTLQELLDTCVKDETLKSEFQYTLWALLARGMITTDMLHPITMNSPVWIQNMKVDDKNNWSWRGVK